MLGQEKKRSVRNTSLILDIVHIVVGIIIAVFAIVAFLNPEAHMILFSVIFLLAGILNLLNGVEKIKTGRGQKKQKISGGLLLVIGAALLLLCLISAITICRG